MNLAGMAVNIYRDQLTNKKKKQSEKQQTGYNNRLGWVFVSKDFTKETTKAVRTYGSLFNVSKDYTYFTPNTFYRNDLRRLSTLRWINAMSIDIDAKNGENAGMILPDVQELITEAGLPMPSLIVQTPSKGFHVHWFLEQSKRASDKLNAHYSRIQTCIAEMLKGDVHAIGPERLFRLPTDENTVFHSQERVSFDDLCEWFQLVQEQDQQDVHTYKKGFCKGYESLLQHPAVQKILEGVNKGQRDMACYTLALAYKAAGYDEKTAEAYLHNWNQKNTPQMRQIEVKRKVRSAYRGRFHAPSAKKIRELSGMLFSYVIWEEAKPREERTYSHIQEWEGDVLAFIRAHGGIVSGSQRDLAEQITSSVNADKKIPYATFKKVIARLEEQEILSKKVSGKGRGASTELCIVDEVKARRAQSEASKKEQDAAPKNNGLNSNTIKDTVVGGTALPLSIGSSLALPKETLTPVSLPTASTLSKPAPIPGNVPSAFVSALSNRSFVDGRFIFRAWGKIQLAFKAFGVTYHSIAATDDYIRLAVDAVAVTVEKKGSMIAGDFQGDESFLKYLFGTMKGLFANYRSDQLTQFVEEIEGLGEITLSHVGIELEDELKAARVVDRQLVETKLAEIEREQSARQRRKHYHNHSAFDLNASLNQFKLFMKTDD
ncbi:primase C-terminal domain-containing protein [Priestia megaterium]|uniref:primase C-terminal domain-containing protein n=1 Tax=Priestia megaterium TaxID=1404 RepID=UPI00272FBD94|nr:primase C-terminal domain-containing protein [Priestia megaterium]MDP1471898.1 primase C-terminal domain-containing protein [Priestia megaterium]